MYANSILQWKSRLSKGHINSKRYNQVNSGLPATTNNIWSFKAQAYNNAWDVFQLEMGISHDLGLAGLMNINEHMWQVHILTLMTTRYQETNSIHVQFPASILIVSLYRVF